MDSEGCAPFSTVLVHPTSAPALYRDGTCRYPFFRGSNFIDATRERRGSLFGSLDRCQEQGKGACFETILKIIFPLAVHVALDERRQLALTM